MIWGSWRVLATPPLTPLTIKAAWLSHLRLDESMDEIAMDLKHAWWKHCCLCGLEIGIGQGSELVRIILTEQGVKLQREAFSSNLGMVS